MKYIHMIGIGGTGLSAIALVLLQQGYRVSGSDREVSPLFELVTKAGAQTWIGHTPDHILEPDLVIRSSAIPDDNPEVQAALSRGIPVMKRRDYLPELTRDKATLAIAGSHGKTTTTAMLIWILHCLRTDPSFIAGGVVKQLGCNAKAGTGPFFVIEADEYDHMFLGLTPKIALVTNIEHDHVDCFPTPEDYQAAFQSFLEQVEPDGMAIMCADDSETATLMKVTPSFTAQMVSYGTTAEAIYCAENINYINGLPQFELIYRPAGSTNVNIQISTEKLGVIHLKTPGHHNVLNAVGVLAIIHQLGLPLDEAIQALGEFSGAGRRFELVSQANQVTIIDDYGHHPSEIAATLQAAHTRYPGRRIWAVWQPHTYARTQKLFDGFVQALNLAEKILVLKIYAARDSDPYFSAEQIADALPQGKTVYAKDFGVASKFLLDHLESGDVVIVFSAGDATELSQSLALAMKQQEMESLS